MAPQHCATCGREFDRDLTNPTSSPNCPACNLLRPPAAAAGLPAPRPRVTISPFEFPITLVLIAANVLVFVAMLARGVSFMNPTPQQAIDFGADFGPLTLGGQPWRLFTSMFVHFGIVHIGLNMWCLWNLGRAAERLLGRLSYLFAYIASGLCGSIASVYWHPRDAGAGASGAIFGLAGVLVTFVYLKKTPSSLQINSRFLGSLGTFIAYNLIFGALPGISNAAHIGGLVMGLAVGAVLPSASASEATRRTQLSVVSMAVVAVLVGSFLTVKRQEPGVSELSSIQKLMSQGKTDEALLELQQVTAKDPNFAPAQALLSTIYFQQRRYPDALAALQKAYEAEPNNTAYQQKLGNAYLTLGEFNQAIPFFQKLAAQKPKDPRNFLGLGYAYVGLHQLDQAVEQFQHAVQLDPKSPGPQHALGQALLQSGRYAEAQQVYRKLLAQFPNDPQAKAALDFATSHLKSQQGS